MKNGSLFHGFAQDRTRPCQGSVARDVGRRGLIGRREFLVGGGTAALAGCAGLGGARPVRFLVTADVHYRPGIFPHDTPEQLDRIIARGVAEDVDFGIQLGDFQHNATRDRAFIDRWNDAPFHALNVVGNHDDDATTAAETRAALRLERGWYRYDCGGVRVIVLDTNYALIDGRYVHYARDCGFVQWKLPKGAGMRLHPDEFPFLEESLDSAPGVCVVASHRSLFGDDPDAQRVRAIFAAANRARPGRVTLALNGHNHCDLLRVREGVSYYTVNSPNHCWIPLKHTAYPAEDMRRWTGIDHIVAYDGTPLSAIVTLTPDGRFSVKGMSGGFWRDVQPAQISPKFANLTASIKDRT